MASYVTSNGMIVSVPNSGTTSNVSASGVDQNTAAQITTAITVVSQVPSGSGVILPPTSTVEIAIINRGSNALLVYPPVGSQIETFGVNLPVAIAVGGTADFDLIGGSWFAR